MGLIRDILKSKKMFPISKEIIVLCQILNGFPLKYNISSKGSSFVSFCRTSFLWGVALVMFQTVLSFLAVLKDISLKQLGSPIRMRSNTAVIAILLDVATLNLMAITMLYGSVKQHQKFINMCSILAKFDKVIPRKLIEPRLRTKLVLIITHTFALLTGSIIVETRGFMRRYGHNGFIIYYPLYTTYFAQVSLFVQFTRICHVIAMRFREVNKMIKEEVIKRSCRGGRQMCLPDVNFITSVEQGSRRVHNIQTLMELYWQLCEAVHLANAFYGCQLLAAVFSSFIHIVITLYYFFLHLWPAIHMDEISYLVLQGCWVPTHIAHLVLLVRPSTAVTDAANETAPMICKLMNQDLNPEIKDQLESFLLQLLHHNARFSALGFFQIHSRIITSVAGSVTTYLVILIQFQTMS